VSEDGTEVGVVQIHPDAASMEFHMGVVAQRAARAYAQTLEATTGIQVYGEPSEAVLEMLRRQAGAGVPMTFKRHHLGGFTPFKRAEADAVSSWTLRVIAARLRLCLGYHRGRPPPNKGELHPTDPPTVEEIVAVMRSIGDRAEWHRLRALVVLLWRAGLPDQRSAVTARAIGIALAARCSFGAESAHLAAKRFRDLLATRPPNATAAVRTRAGGAAVSLCRDLPSAEAVASR
jgi:hypothetical protein